MIGRWSFVKKTKINYRVRIKIFYGRGISNQITSNKMWVLTEKSVICCLTALDDNLKYISIEN